MKESDLSTEKPSTANSVPVTMRLKEDVAKRFKEYAQKDNMSQGDFLEKLLQSYGQPQQEKPAEKTPVPLILCKKNFLTANPNMPSEPTRTYCFVGEVKYWPQSMFGCPATYFQNQLSKEFAIEDPNSLKQYNMQHVLNLLYDEKVKKYLVYEILMLIPTNLYMPSIAYNPHKANPLTVRRCKHVTSFSEVCERFGTYASQYNLDGIEIAMSEQISPDKIDLFEQYF